MHGSGKAHLVTLVPVDHEARDELGVHHLRAVRRMGRPGRVALESLLMKAQLLAVDDALEGIDASSAEQVREGRRC
eukprot:4419083-Pleurochrysis_carterae.AAC.1